MRFLILLLCLACTKTQDVELSKTSPSKGPNRKIQVLCLGDSLTKGYGVEEREAWPAILQQTLDETYGKVFDVRNGGVSGSTTASGLSRLEWYLDDPPQVMILGLGANDGLRGVDLGTSKGNLDEVIKRAKDAKIQVVLAGMKLPPNYGAAYTKQFEEMYQSLAKKHELELIPFLLVGVGGVKELNLSDNIHPNAKGHAHVADTVFRALNDVWESYADRK